MMRSSFIDGLMSALPAALALFLVYCAFGMLAEQNHLTILEAATMTILMLAAPSQTFIIENQDIPLTSVLTTITLLNLKFMLMTAATIPLWQRHPWKIFAATYFMANSSYMLVAANKHTRDPFAFYMGTVVPIWSSGFIATILGFYLLGAIKGADAFLMMLAHIMMPIYFACLTMLRWREVMIPLATFAGFVLTPVLLQVMDKKLLILVWLVVAILITSWEERSCGKQ
ncbi:MAG: AzlC family ABC transporter permease [Proteobacteria bacterium]|nr:AzlC family ABC transporter permease [Pseudomonadota bacterium]